MTKEKKEHKKHKGFGVKRVFKIIMWIVLGLFALLFAIGLINNPSTCKDRECFLEKANACEGALYFVDEDYGEILYATDDDCEFRKRVVKLAESESGEMKELLEGKKYVCSYNEGEFNEEWLNSLFGDIEDCEGELKDIVGKLIIFT